MKTLRVLLVDVLEVEGVFELWGCCPKGRRGLAWGGWCRGGRVSASGDWGDGGGRGGGGRRGWARRGGDLAGHRLATGTHLGVCLRELPAAIAVRGAAFTRVGWSGRGSALGLGDVVIHDGSLGR